MSEPQQIGSLLSQSPLYRALCEQTDMIEVKCHGLPVKDEYGRIRGREQCSNIVTLPRGQAKFAGDSLCCDACCKAYDHARRVEACRDEWQRWMRENAERYNDFSTEHELFNAEAWKVAKKVPVSKNLILYGPTGTGKTFLMLQKLKAGLWHGKRPVVLWADQLKRLTQQRYVGRDIQPYEEAGILGLEELFGEDSAREAYTSFIRNLIDVRLRLNRPTIITTQLTSKDVAGEMNKYDNETKADSERREAILRRIKQDYVAVSTDRNFDHEGSQSIF